LEIVHRLPHLVQKLQTYQDRFQGDITIQT